jgi:nucleoside 2-deoxyribosyltransferase
LTQSKRSAPSNSDGRGAVITICSSAAFYRHVNELQDKLEALGYRVIVPSVATKMRESGNYTVSDYKTWYENDQDWHKKAQLMRAHFDAVTKADAILVVNDTKHGVDGYIGPNVLMEMGLAFVQQKPIFVLNSIAHDMPIYEEVMGMGSVILSRRH